MVEWTIRKPFTDSVFYMIFHIHRDLLIRARSHRGFYICDLCGKKPPDEIILQKNLLSNEPVINNILDISFRNNNLQYIGFYDRTAHTLNYTNVTTPLIKNTIIELLKEYDYIITKFPKW